MTYEELQEAFDETVKLHNIEIDAYYSTDDVSHKRRANMFVGIAKMIAYEIAEVCK